jgi:polynucleotide 5'-kinase involved in rRNA processing
MVVTRAEIEDKGVSRALDMSGSSKMHMVLADAYNGVLCSLTRQDGEDFAIGFVESIDWENLTMQVLSTAVPPAPVRIVRLGSIRIDRAGRELGEVAPWRL